MTQAAEDYFAIVGDKPKVQELAEFMVFQNKVRKDADDVFTRKNKEKEDLEKKKEALEKRKAKDLEEKKRKEKEAKEEKEAMEALNWPYSIPETPLAKKLCACASCLCCFWVCHKPHPKPPAETEKLMIGCNLSSCPCFNHITFTCWPRLCWCFCCWFCCKEEYLTDEGTITRDKEQKAKSKKIAPIEAPFDAVIGKGDEERVPLQAADVTRITPFDDDHGTSVPGAHASQHPVGEDVNLNDNHVRRIARLRVLDPPVEEPADAPNLRSLSKLTNQPAPLRPTD